MQSAILERKRIVKDKDGRVFIDLTSKSLSYLSQGETINAFYVGSDMKMRPDLISHAAYGNTDNYDIILKYNGISNPFSVDENDLILIPNLEFMINSMDDPTENNDSEDIRNQYIDSNKTSKIDPKKIAYDEAIKKLRKSTKGGKFNSYQLPPNLADPGDKEGDVLENDSILLGGDVTKKKTGK